MDGGAKRAHFQASRRPRQEVSGAGDADGGEAGMYGDESAAMTIDIAGVVDAFPALVWTSHPDGTVDFLNRQWMGGSAASGGRSAPDRLLDSPPASGRRGG